MQYKKSEFRKTKYMIIDGNYVNTAEIYING